MHFKAVFKQTPTEHLTLIYARHGCIQANDLQAFEIDVCTSRMHSSEWPQSIWHWCMHFKAAFNQKTSEHLTLMYALQGCIQANDLRASDTDACTSRMYSSEWPQSIWHGYKHQGGGCARLHHPETTATSRSPERWATTTKWGWCMGSSKSASSTAQRQIWKMLYIYECSMCSKDCLNHVGLYQPVALSRLTESDSEWDQMQCAKQCQVSRFSLSQTMPASLCVHKLSQYVLCVWSLDAQSERTHKFIIQINGTAKSKILVFNFDLIYPETCFEKAVLSTDQHIM